MGPPDSPSGPEGPDPGCWARGYLRAAFQGNGCGSRSSPVPARKPSSELDQLRRLVQERTADLQRVKAEYDNYRKRVRRDRLAVREIAVANVVRALLPVLDAADRACANEPLTSGLRDIADSLKEQLGSLGVTSFGEVGDWFDPACHDALTHHVAPEADGFVCSAVLRPGYRLGENLLRPATVEVTGSAQPTRSAPAPRCGGRGSSARDVGRGCLSCGAEACPVRVHRRGHRLRCPENHWRAEVTNQAAPRVPRSRTRTRRIRRPGQSREGHRRGAERARPAHQPGFYWLPLVSIRDLVSANRIRRSSVIMGMAHAG
ncbi:nucleotide exchange factor GrpE [Streptomyces sp900105755]|uniref:Protein GrpE n=1 Tax=Streptomyces sp. 900105755 TaxID=3154389 RepID=A0ABV1TSB4_9ACTN